MPVGLYASTVASSTNISPLIISNPSSNNLNPQSLTQTQKHNHFNIDSLNYTHQQNSLFNNKCSTVSSSSSSNDNNCVISKKDFIKVKSNANNFLNENFFNNLIVTSDDDLNMKINSTSTKGSGSQQSQSQQQLNSLFFDSDFLKFKQQNIDNNNDVIDEINNKNDYFATPFSLLLSNTAAAVKQQQHPEISSMTLSENTQLINFKSLESTLNNTIEQQNQRTTSSSLSNNNNNNITSITFKDQTLYNNINNCQIELMQQLQFNNNNNNSKTDDQDVNNLKLKNSQLVLNDLFIKKSEHSETSYFSYPCSPPLSSTSSSSSLSSCSSSSSKEIDQLKIKNNIDLAIDSVIDRCRQEIISQEQEQLLNLDFQQDNPVEETQIETPADTDNSNDTIPPMCASNAMNLLMNSQPMSKSSKARTSYISSLIANREKTSKDEEKKQSDDKQKRISQNILSILATVSSNNKPASNVVVVPAPLTLPTTIIVPQNKMNNKNNTSNSLVSPSKTQAVWPQTSLTSPSTNNQPTSLNDLITMINSTPNKSNNLSIISPTPTQPTSIPMTIQKIKPQTSQKETIDFFINNNHQNTDLTSQTEKDEEKIKSFLECTNLKLLLSKPLVSNNLQQIDESQIKRLDERLAESTFDKKIVKIQVKTENEAEVTETNDNKTTTTTPKKKPTKKRKSQATVIKPESSLNDITCTIDAVANAVLENNDILTKIPATPVKSKNSKRKAPIEIPISTLKAQQPLEVKVGHLDQESQNEKLPTFKTKKLKTIADIVKHNTQNLLPHQPQQQQYQYQNRFNSSINFISNNLLFQDFTSPNDNETLQQQSNITNQTDSNSLTVSWINNNTNNILSSLDCNYGHHFSLDENELSTPLIDNKYIDLDEIDVNPLDTRQFTNNTNKSTNNNTQDEFNLQFSVCSSSSPGFSEPSSFSCSSSSMSSNNGNNNQNVNTAATGAYNSLFGSESASSPINSSSTAYHSSYDSSPSSLSSSNNNNKDLLLMHQIQNQNFINMSNNNWNLIEFSTGGNSNENEPDNDNSNNRNTLNYHSTHDLINDQPNNNNHNNNVNSGSGVNVYNSNCGDNMFGSFNFFNDEIKLEI